MDIFTANHEPFDSNNNFRRLSDTHHSAHSEPLIFPNSPFFDVPPPFSDVEGVLPILSSILDFLALFEDPNATPSPSFSLYRPGV